MAKYLVDQKEKARDKEVQQKLHQQPLLTKQDCKVLDNQNQNHAMTTPGTEKTSSLISNPARDRNYNSDDDDDDDDDQTIFKGKSDW